MSNELACPDCTFTGKNPRGLSIHRRAKHGTPSPTRAEEHEEQLPGTPTAAAAELQERDERIAALEGRRIADYLPAEQGAHMLQTLSRLGSETVAVLVAKAGKESILSEAAAAEVAWAEQAETADSADTADTAETPAPVVQGRTDAAGYRYLEGLGMSIKVSGGEK